MDAIATVTKQNNKQLQGKKLKTTKKCTSLSLRLKAVNVGQPPL